MPELPRPARAVNSQGAIAGWSSTRAISDTATRPATAPSRRLISNNEGVCT